MKSDDGSGLSLGINKGVERSLSVCSCRDSISCRLCAIHVVTKRKRDSISESILWLYCAVPKWVPPERIRHWKNQATHRAMDSPSKVSLRHPTMESEYQTVEARIGRCGASDIRT